MPPAILDLPPPPSIRERHSGDPVRDQRSRNFHEVDGVDYDVAIIGAGISGARIFHEAVRQGYRALLIDRGDFAGGTSQASGMMIWGGLLYLKDLDFRTVFKLSCARDQLLEDAVGSVRSAPLRYVPDPSSGRNRHLLKAGFLLYWLMGSSRRSFPAYETAFRAKRLFGPDRCAGSLRIEEAQLRTSDSRFVLEWILPCLNSGGSALTHCDAHEMRFDRGRGRWRLELRDRLHGYGANASARVLVNAAGVWTDSINQKLGIESPFRHVLSKGVYLNFQRPDPLEEILVFDTEGGNDVLTLVPWGPLAMFGPSETQVTSPQEGFHATPEDVRGLLKAAQRHLHTPPDADDIVSLRCGVRPLAVKRNAAPSSHTADMSRRHEVHFDSLRQAVSVYGGKLTSSGLLAEEVCAQLRNHLGPSRAVILEQAEPARLVRFPGMPDSVPDAVWCRDHEQCHTLEDYLRRRTNISQWIPRCGLGRASERREELRAIARVFSGSEETENRALGDYESSVRHSFDELIARSL